MKGNIIVKHFGIAKTNTQSCKFYFIIEFEIITISINSTHFVIMLRT